MYQSRRRPVAMHFDPSRQPNHVMPMLQQSMALSRQAANQPALQEEEDEDDPNMVGPSPVGGELPAIPGQRSMTDMFGPAGQLFNFAKGGLGLLGSIFG